jgi:hypothetical protein
MVVGNGCRTSFWKNFWIGDGSLAVKFPILFDLTIDKDITVNKVLSSNFDALSFRRRMTSNLQGFYDDLVALCSDYNLSNQDDKLIWNLGNKGFTVNSLYKKNSMDQIKVPYRFLWKSKLPQKIKVFFWLVIRNKILTKDNLKKEIGRDLMNDVFVVAWNRLIIYFLNALLPDLFGEWFKLLLIWITFQKNIEEICDSWMKNPKNKISNLLIFGCGAIGLFGEPEMIGFLVKKF